MIIVLYFSYVVDCCIFIITIAVPFTIGQCAPHNVQRLGDVSALSSCVEEPPLLTGNVITATYYPNLECNGTAFYKVQFDYKWVNCLGGFLLDCSEKLAVEAFLCQAQDCSGTCSSLGALPSGTCIPDSNVPGTSFTFECTSGSTSLAASLFLVLSVLLVMF